MTDSSLSHPASARLFALLALAEVGLVFGWHTYVVHSHQFPLVTLRLTYAGGFGLFAIFCLGALSRYRVGTQFAVWRLLTLVMSAALAAVEVNLHGFSRGIPGYFWGWAMMGACVVCVLARMVPGKLREVWIPSAESR